MKQFIHTHTRSILLIALCFLMPSMMKAGDAAWVGYDQTTKTLTFHYDQDKGYTSEIAYDLNSGNSRPNWLEHKADIVNVKFNESFKSVRPTTCDAWFTSCKNLTSIEGLENLNTSEVTDMHGMFYGCSSLTSLDLSALTTSTALTDAGYMFYGCTSLVKLDISGLNTSAVTNMQYMFANCSELKAILVKDLFSVESLGTDTDDDYYMFYGCTSLPGFEEGNVGKTYAKLTSEGGYFNNSDRVAWVGYNDTDKTLTFYYDNNLYITDDKTYLITNDIPQWSEQNQNATKAVFDESFKDARPTMCFKWFCEFKNLKTIEGMENFNTSEVNQMNYMFYNCSSLTSLDLSHMNTAKVTTVSDMFSGCSSLTEIKLSDQFVGTSLQWTSDLFYGCSSLKDLDLSQFSTSETLDKVNSMFEGCSSLESLNLTKMNTKGVANMDKMFSGCSKLKAIFVSDLFSTEGLGSSSNMFAYCDSLPGFNDYYTGDERAKYYPNGYFYKEFTPWAEYVLTTNTLTFHYDASKPSSTLGVVYDVPLTGEGTPAWTSSTSYVTKVVFDKNFALTRPTSCSNWFKGMSNITTIKGAEYLNTSKVTTMEGMFNGCSNITSLNLTTWDISSLTEASEMFKGCSALDHIYVSDDFVLSETCNGTDMFNGASKLPHYQAEKYDQEQAHYKEGGYLTVVRSFSVGNKQHTTYGWGDETTCYDDVTFNDDSLFSATYDFTLADQNTASYTRTVSNHWATLCLPFAYSADGNSTASFYSIKDYTDDNIDVEKLTGTIAAGTPVLAYVAEGTELTVSATAAAAVYAPVEDNVLHGVFTQTNVEDPDYIIANDRFWNAKYLKKANNWKVKNIYVAPYRAYLTLSSEAKPNSISIDADAAVTDRLVSLRPGTDLAAFLEGAELYDLQGRRLTAPKSGVMIIRKGGVSRKVMVKGSQGSQTL